LWPASQICIKPPCQAAKRRDLGRERGRLVALLAVGVRLAACPAVIAANKLYFAAQGALFFLHGLASINKKHSAAFFNRQPPNFSFSQFPKNRGG